MTNHADITPSTSGRFGFSVTDRYGKPVLELHQAIEVPEGDRRREFLVDGRWSKCGEWNTYSISQLSEGAALSIDLGAGWTLPAEDTTDFRLFAEGVEAVIGI